MYACLLALTTHYDLVPPDFIVIPPTEVIADNEGDENDLPRHLDKQGEFRQSVTFPDPAEVQPPHLLAALSTRKIKKMWPLYQQQWSDNSLSRSNS